MAAADAGHPLLAILQRAVTPRRPQAARREQKPQRELPARGIPLAPFAPTVTRRRAPLPLKRHRQSSLPHHCPSLSLSPSLPQKSSLPIPPLLLPALRLIMAPTDPHEGAMPRKT